MIKLVKPIAYYGQKFGIAVSGGIDSMVALSFLKKYPQNNFDVFHVNHGSEYDIKAEQFVRDYCSDNKINCHVYCINTKKPKGCSWEEHWRNERYKFLHSHELEIMTAHTLDDNVETWLFYSMHGSPRIIPYRKKNVIRPFMLTTKNEFKKYAKSNGVQWLEDPSNRDTNFNRNQIRHNIIPQALKVNPGLFKVIAKKVREENG
ncbi:hypothetical protein RVBP17_3200 [Pseudomonas phage sp. 30-3]|nr:tRNA(Ile)-lysidine synthase [Pseudomonas phage Callisto]BDR25635.1 hypothetical protein RVBP16_0750 [Pseudomonas phage sp. 30-2]BDR26277.1 hypothetical protein RVBP17_3200 [Pseudomonas phage sp. 30-3]